MNTKSHPGPFSGSPSVAVWKAQEATAEAVEGLTGAAVRSGVDELYKRHAAVLAARGAQGRRRTERELEYHLQVLTTALIIGVPDIFTDHVHWLATVLGSRRVPQEMLDETLQILGEFFEEALDPAMAVEVRGVLERGRGVLDSTSGNGGTGSGRPVDLPQVHRLTRSLLKGDRDSVRTIADRCRAAIGDYAECAGRLFQPALYDVGALWERNKITVAQEHLATAMAQTMLTRHYLALEPDCRMTGLSALFAAAEGNLHALGVRMVADAFALSGWSVQYLGANVPTNALIAQIDRTRPDLVGLSATLVDHLPGLRRAIGRIKNELGTRRPAVMIGGLATNKVEGVWRWVGADAWSPDVRHARSVGT